ncbi:MAG TPA: PQQ-dependent sugar dehydrogenase [Longimicrobiales bacterium]
MRIYPLILGALLLTGMGGCNGTYGEASSEQEAAATAESAEPEQQCDPVETRSPNGRGQRPAFRGQTRACRVRSNVAFDVTVVARGLEHPWAVEPLPGGDFLVTEKPGRMRIVAANGQLGAPISGLPRVDAGGQGGLLDVALSPTFDSDRTIFWSFTEPRNGGNGTSVARAVLSQDRRSLQNVRVIFRALPTYDNNMHYGSRLTFAPDGKLFVTTGERSDANMRMHAQRTDNHLGKVMRINADGSVPGDNPFVGQSGARGEIWSIGHRNLQAAAVDAEGRFWTVEHGPRGGDELNLSRKGTNYGWPVVTYGIEYSGRPIRGAVTAKQGFQQPVYYWDPVIAPSGAQFYTGSAFPAWRNSLFIGGLASERLVRLVLRGERVTGEEHLLTDRGQRIRDVRQGPDGALYLVTDQADGQLLRIAPRR